MPGVDGAAAGTDRKDQEHARERRPKPVASSACALGAAENVVGGNADQAGDHLGEAEALAVAALAQVGPFYGFRQLHAQALWGGGAFVARMRIAPTQSAVASSWSGVRPCTGRTT